MSFGSLSEDTRVHRGREGVEVGVSFIHTGSRGRGMPLLSFLLPFGSKTPGCHRIAHVHSSSVSPV